MTGLLFCGRELAAVNKPPGVSLATGRGGGAAAVARLLACLSQREREQLAGPLFLVHRLDVATSGVVLLARSREVHRQLAAAFARGQVHRVYLALVWGKVRPAQGCFDVPLGPDRRDRRKMRPDPAGKRATTLYRRLAAQGPVSLVKLAPLTGRTHQLRVHLAAAGHPIVGDDLYGGPRHHGVRDRELRSLLSPPHLLLHAFRLELPPALGGLAFEAPLPEAFTEALERLGLASALAQRDLRP